MVYFLKICSECSRCKRAAHSSSGKRYYSECYSSVFSFRAMVASGFLMLLLFILATWAVAKRNAENKPWLLKYALFALPLPWIAAQTGWYVAEGGRQPWSIGEILPTHLSASSLSTGDVWGSILALAAFYTILLIIEMYLMIKFARLGPSSLHTGKYHFEKQEPKTAVNGEALS